MMNGADNKFKCENCGCEITAEEDSLCDDCFDTLNGIEDEDEEEA